MIIMVHIPIQILHLSIYIVLFIILLVHFGIISVHNCTFYFVLFIYTASKCIWLAIVYLVCAIPGIIFLFERFPTLCV